VGQKAAKINQMTQRYVPRAHTHDHRTVICHSVRTIIRSRIRQQSTVQ